MGWQPIDQMGATDTRALSWISGSGLLGMGLRHFKKCCGFFVR